MISAILHLITGVLFIVGGVIVYYKFYLKNKLENYTNDLLKKIFYFYIFLLGYNLALSLPFLLSGDLKIISLGYNFAIIFLFLALLPFWKIWFEILKVNYEKQKIYLTIIFFIGLVIAIVQTADLRLPIITVSNLIIWNSNYITSFISAIMTAVLPLGLTFTIIKNLPKELGQKEKIKTILFSAGCLMYAISSIYLVSGNITNVIIGFIFFPTATIILTATFLITIPKKDTNITI